MSQLNLIATSTFGLESVVKREIADLGFNIVKVEDGKVEYLSDEYGIAKSNLWLRTADRVLLKFGEFKAFSFEELFQNTKALPWADWIPEDGHFIVTGKSVKSKLYSVPDCQSIVEKAVVEKLKQTYHTEWFKKTGAKYEIQVSILKDVVTLTIDTSGQGLHKRGYRINTVEAPLKETLASALIQLSYWNPDRILIDPFCGSGTLPIEAAMIARNIAPGLSRSFAYENWERIDKSVCKQARTDAYRAIDYDKELKIYASDIDPKAVNSAINNAEEAGVDDCIEFSTKPVSEVDINDDYSIVITNPPYGIRIGTADTLNELYKDIKEVFGHNDTISLYLITSDENFERLYGKRANKKRKLYNGRIKVDYYQYYGKRPPRVY